MSELATIQPSLLSELEEKAHLEWQETKEAPMPLVLALNMYQLFLNGYSTEEICQVNGNKFHLGQIVDARIRYEWDIRKNKQVNELFTIIESKVARVKNESASILSDLLSVAHKIWGDDIKKFLQDGDPKILEKIDPSNFKNYREILQLLATITEKEGKPTQSVKVENMAVQVNNGISKQKMESSVAAELLTAIDASFKKNG